MIHQKMKKEEKKKKLLKKMKADMKKGDSFKKAHKKALKKVGKQWLENLNRLKQEINLEKEDLENIKKV